MDHIFTEVSITRDLQLEMTVSTRDHSPNTPFINFWLDQKISWCAYAERTTADELRSLAADLDQAWAELDALKQTTEKA